MFPGVRSRPFRAVHIDNPDDGIGRYDRFLRLLGFRFFGQDSIEYPATEPPQATPQGTVPQAAGIAEPFPHAPAENQLFKK